MALFHDALVIQLPSSSLKDGDLDLERAIEKSGLSEEEFKKRLKES